MDALRTGVNGGDDTGNVDGASGDGEGGGELMGDKEGYRDWERGRQETLRVSEGGIGNQAALFGYSQPRLAEFQAR